jgi:hypothetical protein
MQKLYCDFDGALLCEKCCWPASPRGRVVGHLGMTITGLHGYRDTILLSHHRAAGGLERTQTNKHSMKVVLASCRINSFTSSRALHAWLRSHDEGVVSTVPKLTTDTIRRYAYVFQHASRWLTSVSPPFQMYAFMCSNMFGALVRDGNFELDLKLSHALDNDALHPKHSNRY